MTIVFNALVKDGTYITDDGLEKPAWFKVGIVCTTRNGGYALKLEQDPSQFKDWDGWIQFAPRIIDDNR